jgi:hypothetical protein
MTEPLPRRRRRSRLGVAIAAAAAAAVLSGCVTGQRPVLEPVPVIDDEAAEVVLDRLARAGSVPFTATYDIIPSTTGVTTTAVVRQLDGRRRVTIGDVDYLIDGGSSRTCRLESDDCDEFVNDALISDLNLTHRFWSDGIADRLVVDASRRTGFSEGRTDTIAGRSAACVDVPVLGGSVLYCALDEGVLARYFNADVSIELTSFTSEVDPESFSADADPRI